MNTAVPQTSYLSVDEYAQLPDVLGFKDELIEGVRVLAPMPKFPHTVVLDKLEEALKKQFSSDEVRIVREAGWRMSVDGTESVPGPDLMVMSVKDYERTAQSGGYFDGQPLFVLEVISPTERRPRRMQKVGLYLEAGAKAVIEIDYGKQCALIYRPEKQAPEEIRDRITSPFVIELSEIW